MPRLFQGKRAPAHAGESWSFHGQGLPYTPFRHEEIPYGEVLWKNLKAREVTVFGLYLSGVAHPAPEAEIKVGNTTGPVLLISSKMDTMRPPEPSAERIMERLQAHDFPYPYRHLSYGCGSHLSVPMELRSAKLFRGNRGHDGKIP